MYIYVVRGMWRNVHLCSQGNVAQCTFMKSGECGAMYIYVVRGMWRNVHL